MSSVFILNVEDYESARYAKTRLLRNAGFHVEEACNGHQALKMVETFGPGLMLLDVRLPDLDGRDVCQRIKNNPATRTWRVIQTSAAFISEADIASGYASGADAYIPAPYTPDELIRLLRSFGHWRGDPAALDCRSVILETDRRDSAWKAK